MSKQSDEKYDRDISETGRRLVMFLEEELEVHPSVSIGGLLIALGFYFAAKRQLFRLPDARLARVVGNKVMFYANEFRESMGDDLDDLERSRRNGRH